MIECKFYPASIYQNPGCDLYMPGFCSLTECYKIDKVSESDKKRRKYEKVQEEEEEEIIAESDIPEESEDEE